MSGYRSEVAIVSSRELDSLRRSRRWLWLGFGVAATFFVLWLWTEARLDAERRAAEELRVLTADVYGLQDEQRELLKHFETAWREQRQTAEAVLEMGGYLQERQEIVDRNRKLGRR